MQTDEQLIADLTASLRQALSYLEADAGLEDPDLTIGTIQTVVLETDQIRGFDGDEANRVLKAAAARLATVQPKRNGLFLRMSPEAADEIGEELSDLLCWVRGFIAGRPDEADHHPMGVKGVREMRICLRSAVLEARNQEDREMPF